MLSYNILEVTETRIKHWNRLSREVFESPSLDISSLELFKSLVDVVLVDVV